MNWLSMNEVFYLGKMLEKFQALGELATDLGAPLNCNLFDQAFDVYDSNGDIVGVIKIVDSGDFGFVPAGDNQ